MGRVLPCSKATPERGGRGGGKDREERGRKEKGKGERGNERVMLIRLEYSVETEEVKGHESQ